MNKILITISLIALSLLASCSSSIQRFDDAVRIKSDNFSKYSRVPSSDSSRVGATLEGTVVEVLIQSRPVSCEEDLGLVSDTMVVFLDKSLDDEKTNIERIPISDIDLIARLVAGPKNEYENINLFENYNETTRFLGIREVPVRKVTIDNCNPCGCYDWDMGMELNCPTRKYSWYFIEARYGLAIYQDFSHTGVEVQRSEILFEGAVGIRFGNKRQWGLGVSGSTGVPAFNSFKGKDYQRPFVALHGRWNSAENKFLGICMQPFVYTDFGIPIDGLSLALPKLDLSTDCKDCKTYLDDLEASGQLPGVDFTWPSVMGFGIGAEMPFLGTDFMSLGADIGFRSMRIGEEVVAAGFDNVPSTRRINMLLFRIGITF